jgi:hypothetical protein
MLAMENTVAKISQKSKFMKDKTLLYWLISVPVSLILLALIYVYLHAGEWILLFTPLVSISVGVTVKRILKIQ